MNNKLIIAAIAVLAVLLAVILIFVSTGLDSQGEEPFVNPSGGLSGSSETENESGSAENSEANGEASSNSSDESEYSNPNSHEDPDLIEDTESSSSASNVSGNGNSGSTSSRPSSGNNSGSTSSNPSSGSSSDSSSGFDSESEPSSLLTYEEYIALSGEEQKNYMYSFSSMDAYFEWYNAAKAKYEEENAGIEIDGSVDLGDYINP